MGKVFLSVAALMVAAGSAIGAITPYTGQQVVNVQGNANFNAAPPSGVQFYQEGGLDFSMDTDAGGNPQYIYNYPFLYPGGGDNTNVLYTGGSYDVVHVKRTDGQNFNSIEMQTGNGFGANPHYVWIRALNNDVPVGDFDFDVSTGTYTGLTGGGFDEIWVSATYDVNQRNMHDEHGYHALMADNFTFGTIPAPGSAAVLGLGGLVASRRRRA